MYICIYILSIYGVCSYHAHIVHQNYINDCMNGECSNIYRL